MVKIENKWIVGKWNKDYYNIKTINAVTKID